MNINNTLNMLIDFNINADELLLIYLIFIGQEEENHTEYFAKWYSNCDMSPEKLKSMLNSLVNKKIIKTYQTDPFTPDGVEFNKRFLNKWIKHSLELGKELWDNYESFLLIDGKQMPLKNISKKFHSLEDFFFHYSSTIKHSIEKHNEIIELLKWARQQKLIKFGILEFVASQKWDDLKRLKEDGGDTKELADSIYIM